MIVFLLFFSVIVIEGEQDELRIWRMCVRTKNSKMGNGCKGQAQRDVIYDLKTKK
jgi:5S rRNA maturation endonuclease (ribonuclease M5)